jgi:hypothetical protein
METPMHHCEFQKLAWNVEKEEREDDAAENQIRRASGSSSIFFPSIRDPSNDFH